jgi:uncharacterized membrane protein
MKKKFIIILLFFLIILNHLYQFYHINENQHTSRTIKNIDVSEATDFTYNEQEIVQTIVADENNFNKINIYLDPVNNTYDGTLYKTMYLLVSLQDEKGNTLEEYKYEKVFFDDDAVLSFQFPTISDSLGKKYYLHIKSYKENDIAIKMIPNESENSNTYVDGELIQNQLIFTTEYKTIKNNSYFYSISLTIILSFGLLLLFFYKKGKNFPIHKQYFILAIVLSLFMILVVPLYVGHDELAHLGRIYEVSNGRLTSHIIGDWPKTEFPMKLVNASFSKYTEIPFRLAAEKDDSSLMYLNMEYTSVYSPISYIPQVIGLWIAKLFSLHPFLWPYVCRIFQALACIFIVYYAIKIAPFGKKMIAFIGLLPTFIQATSLLSADSLLVSCSLLFLSKILQILYEKKNIDKKDFVCLAVLSIIISISKLVYFPLSFLLLLIPLKLKDKSLFKKSIIIIMLSLIIIVLWNGIASFSLTSGQGVNVFYYIKYYLKNPLEFIQITIYTFYNGVGNLISDLFGGMNNWAENTIYDSTIFPVLFFLCYIRLLFNGENKLQTKDKKIMGLLLILTYILISTSLLFTCTPIYSGEIIGIQGRYFISFLFPIYLIFSKEKKEKNASNESIILILIYFAYYLRYICMFL